MRRIDRFHGFRVRRLARPLWLGTALALSLQACASPGVAAEKRRGGLELDADTSLNLGKRFEARGDAETALGLYHKAMTENPNDLEALRALVGLAVRTGQAGLVYDQAALLAGKQPEDAAALVWLAASLNETRRPQEALEALARAEKAGANPFPGLLWTQRGIAHDLSGNHLEAQRAFSHAITLAPGERALPMRVALSLALQGDYPAALRILQMQVSDPAMEQPVRETLAIIYALSGQTETALEIASTAVPGKLAETQRAYFAALPGLSPAAKAYAAHYRRIPQGEAGGQGVSAPMPEPGIDVFEVKPTAVAAPEATSGPEPLAGQPASPALAPPESKLVPVASAPEAEQAGPEPVRTAAEGYWLQLASLPDRARLDHAWGETTGKAASLLEGRAPFVEAQPVNGTLYYRLMLGPFENFAAAREMAGKLGGSGIKSVIRRNVADIEPLKRQ